MNLAALSVQEFDALYHAQQLPPGTPFPSDYPEFTAPHILMYDGWDGHGSARGYSLKAVPLTAQNAEHAMYQADQLLNQTRVRAATLTDRFHRYCGYAAASLLAAAMASTGTYFGTPYLPHAKQANDYLVDRDDASLAGYCGAGTIGIGGTIVSLAGATVLLRRRKIVDAHADMYHHGADIANDLLATFYSSVNGSMDGVVEQEQAADAQHDQHVSDDALTLAA